ncbi:MAG: AAA family ATPase [Alphaproteobacteria bacterium]
MPARPVKADKVGIPRFKWKARKQAQIFDLSSHERARDALEFGLQTKEPGFNVFVLGPDRAGRMTETLNYIRQTLDGRPPAPDWVYLNNFKRTHRPKPYRLPAGTGRRLRDALEGFVAGLRAALKQTFEGDRYQEDVKSAQQRAAAEAEGAMAQLRADAADQGLGIFQGEHGPVIAPADANGGPVGFDTIPPEERETKTRAAQAIAERLNAINAKAAKDRAALVDRVADITRDAARDTCKTLMQPLIESFGGYGLNRWFVELEQDILDNLRAFGPAQDMKGRPNTAEPPERRYAVNLLVDNGDLTHPPIVLESTPSYGHLFGRIEYRPGQTHLETDFTLIRAGALHRANGGVLVLRADALAADPLAWPALVGALRDGQVRIEEPHRQGALPVIGAPSPKAIDLDLKVVIVGTPAIYYGGYSRSPDFQTLFKVKADIAQDMPANAANLALYGTVLRDRVKGCTGRGIDDGAVGYLLGMATRWNGDRTRLSAQIERLDDIVIEASARNPGKKKLTEADLVAAHAAQLRRNDRIEGHSQDMIERGTVMIATEGEVTGQINALTVRDMGDHAYGGPSRVTARASVGRHGVLNIERQVDMGGPIQQKGAMVLQGYLSGLFARTAPLSFNCSITFEQNYGGVEGDSASLAELIAVLSDLGGVPLRQDLAITGSVNQRGESQAVGGVHHKVEGFFKACRRRGLTGSQGVLVPLANADSLVVDDETAAAIRDGKFHLYTIRHVDEALELFSGLKAGKPNASGTYPEDTFYGRVQRQLQGFDNALFRREAALVRAGEAE